MSSSVVTDSYMGEVREEGRRRGYSVIGQTLWTSCYEHFTPASLPDVTQAGASAGLGCSFSHQPTLIEWIIILQGNVGKTIKGPVRKWFPSPFPSCRTCFPFALTFFSITLVFCHLCSSQVFLPTFFVLGSFSLWWFLQSSAQGKEPWAQASLLYSIELSISQGKT